MKRIFLFSACVVALSVQAQTAVLNVDLSRERMDIIPTQYGVFLEGVDHVGEGGLYAELIQNRSFEDEAQPVRNHRFGPNGEGERFGGYPAPGTIPAWYAANGQEAASRMEIITDNLFDERQKKALQWTITQASPQSVAAIANTGYWGIDAVKGDKYTLTFWARADKRYKGKLVVGLQSKDSAVWHGCASVKGKIGRKWRKYTVSFVPEEDCDYTRIVMTADAPGTLYLDMVSLFPPTFKNRPNGCRKDLAEMLLALQPQYLRFAGSFSDWKTTTGAVEMQIGGMGYHEFLQLAEDIGAEPILAVNATASIQDVLDAIEYANGEKDTPYGRMRIRNGHKKPFNMHYVELGDKADEWRIQLVETIGKCYPEVQILGDASSWNAENSLKDALKGAAELMEMEDGGAVAVCGYTPALVNVRDYNHSPGMIYFDAAHSWAAPSYYVQRLLSENKGATMVYSEVVQPRYSRPQQFRVGVGSWNTEVEYKDVQVCSFPEEVEYANFSDLNIKKGKWLVTDGIISQRSQTTECVAIFPEVMTGTSYDLTLKARKVAGDEGFLIIFDYYDDDNYKWLRLGGDNNNQYGIETMWNGTRHNAVTACGTISENQWYDIRIEVRDIHVRCYVDGTLYHEVQLPQPNMLFANAMVDKTTGEKVVRIVNLSDVEIPVQLNVKGADITSGTATLLTADSGKAENTFDTPEHVVPQTVAPLIVEDCYVAPANSLTVFRMN